MFVQILNEVTEETKRQCQAQGSNHFDDYLFFAISIWCQELEISQDATAYILKEYEKLNEIQELTRYLYKEWEPERKEEKNIFGQVVKVNWKTSKLYNLVFNLINMNNEYIKFIVLIAFVIAAVGSFIYKVNKQSKPQMNRQGESREYNSHFSSFTGQTSTDQASTKQFLVLVVSHSQADFLELLKSKRRINVNDGEELYKMTKHLCLWLGSETDFNQKKVNINRRHKVLEGEESEFDIYLIYIELSQAYEGFKKDVSQVDRHNAFRKFDNLANFEISHRLQMEAYENFEVYNR